MSLARRFVTTTHLPTSEMAEFLARVLFDVLNQQYRAALQADAAAAAHDASGAADSGNRGKRSSVSRSLAWMQSPRFAMDPGSPSSEFAQFATLCDEPNELARSLVDLMKHEANVEATVEAELLIRAHYCSVLVCNMEGISSILELIRARADVYASVGRFDLLVRLLSSIRKYREMQYILDILVQRDQFELILHRNADMDRGSEMELKMVLYDYMRRRHPNDTERLNMIFLHFSMHREIGESLMGQASARLRSLGAPSPKRDRELETCMQMFIEAAEEFSRVDCLQLSQRCLCRARLCAMQLRNPTARLINMSKEEVSRWLAQHPTFAEALLVADAYDACPTPGDWVRPLLQQVVVAGNVQYFRDYLATLAPPSEAVCAEISSLYKIHPQRQALSANMQLLLDLLPNVRVRYMLARDLGMQEYAKALLTSEAGIALRQV